MPTGYTAGILDGTTKTFNDYAKICSRAFMIHLRDESMGSEYKKSEVSTYHSERIEEAEDDIARLATITDEELIEQEKIKLIDSKKYHLDAIEKARVDEIKLNEFLEKAKAYVPPTLAHDGIATFMVSQLKDTIKHDCGGSYHENELKSIDKKIKNLDATELRNEIKTQAAKDIIYHTKENTAAVNRVDDNNKWYEDFINSLK